MSGCHGEVYGRVFSRCRIDGLSRISEMGTVGNFVVDSRDAIASKNIVTGKLYLFFRIIGPFRLGEMAK